MSFKKKWSQYQNVDTLISNSQDLKIESDVQEPAEPEDDLDIMLGNKKKKKKNVKFPDEDEILEKDEGNIGGSAAHFQVTQTFGLGLFDRWIPFYFFLCLISTA